MQKMACSGNPANFSISLFVYHRRPYRHSACCNQEGQPSSRLRPCLGREPFQAGLACVFIGVAIPDPEAGFEVLPQESGRQPHSETFFLLGWWMVAWPATVESLAQNYAAGWGKDGLSSFLTSTSPSSLGPYVF